MGIINVSALLNLTKGYLKSFCLAVVAEFLITVTKKTQNALTQGCWAHNWDQKLTQNLPRNKTLFCAEVRIRKGQGRKESAISTPGKVKSTVRCPLCSFLPHSRVPGGMPAQPMPEAGQGSPVWQMPGCCPAHQQKGSIYHGNDTQSLRMGAGKSWRGKDGWGAEEFMQWGTEELKILMYHSCGSNKQSNTQLSQRVHKGDVRECSHLQQADQGALQPPLHHSRAGMCCFLEIGKETDTLLLVSLWPPPVSIIYL